MNKMAADIRAARILIVDDMAIMQRVIGNCLSKAGFENLSYAADGQEALDAIEAEMPDLLVLDLNMPKVSGYEVCRILRASEKTANLPILVQSASETPAERVEVFNSGATDFVSKPINQPELLARVCMHLENKFLIKDLSDFHGRMRAELSMAREMQHSLLPDKEDLEEIEKLSGMSFEAYYRASFELGGDLWGAWALDDDHIGLYVLDVSGHGVGAALNTFRLHATMSRFEALRHNPAIFLDSLNRALQPTFPLGQFATMFYGVLNVRTGDLQYAGAGAPRPVVVSKNGETRLLDSSGTPVGIIASAKYENRTTRLHSDESLLCYSDVLLEAPDENDQFIGEDGFVAEVRAEAGAGDRRELVKRLLDHFYKRLPGELPDDLTAVALHLGHLPDALKPSTDTDGGIVAMAAPEGALAAMISVFPQLGDIKVHLAEDMAGVEKVFRTNPHIQALLLDMGHPTEDLTRINNALGEEFLAAAGPIVLVGAEEKATDAETLSEIINSSRYIDQSHGAEALFATVSAEIEEYMLRRSVRVAVETAEISVSDMDTASYRFRTREEAKRIATILASACDEPGAIAIGLTELMVNAVEHGCLDIGHEEKGDLIEKGRLADEIKHRRTQAPYADRFVQIDFKRTPSQISFRIKDPGKGFDHQAFVGRPQDGHTKKHGRGLTMACSCFDELTFLGNGNEALAIHLVKAR